MIEIPMNETQFAAAKQQLATQGVDLSEPSGTISRQGVTADYAWADNKLTIEVKAHPMFLPKSMIESRLKAFLEEKLGTPS
jgi:hypothetical protein